MASDKITFRCGRCGSTQFTFPSASPAPADLISCAGCGAQARYGDVRATALKLAKQQVEQELRKALRGVKGIKLKF